MSTSKNGGTAKSAWVLAVIALAVMVCSVPASAQNNSQHSDWDIFAGYSYADPGGSVNGVPLKGQPQGFGISVTRNFNSWFGMTADFGGHFNGNNRVGTADTGTISAGPKFTWRGEHFNPFAEFLVGWNHTAPTGLSDSNAMNIITGGGIDMKLTQHWALRLIQADYVFANHKKPSPAYTNFSGGRVQTGIVWMLGGGAPPVPASLACSLNPHEVMAGEPVQATASASNFTKGKAVTYTWNTTGGKISGSGESGTVDTTGLAPGNYTVSAHATDGKKSADCSSSFTVKEPPKHPPVVSCSASPNLVKSGEPSTITATCSSPDGRSVSITNWSSSGGRVSGNGSTATLDTAGVGAGTVSVSATCSDDRGLSSSCSANVGVEQVAAPPEASMVGECGFNNKAKPARVDNECKATLDEVALRLQQNPDGTLVAVGNSDAAEKKGASIAAQRAVNSKFYLTSGESQAQIDPSRIAVMSAGGGGKKAQYYFVPSGATYKGEGSAVDESKVKGQARSGAAPKKKKAAAAPSH